jgi:hypothetical protein
VVKPSGVRRCWSLLLALAAACAPALPSSEPLGVGALAEKEQAAELARSSDGKPPVASDTAERSQEEEEASEPTAPVAAEPGEPTAPDAGEPEKAAEATDADAGTRPAAGPVALSGEYQGWDVTKYRIENAPESVERDPNARTRVKQGAGSAIEMVIISSSDGTDLCTFKGTLTGDKVSFDKGQPCFEQGGGSVTATLRSGSAKFSGKQLTMDLLFDMVIDTGEDTIGGEIDYHFEGTRK